MKTIKLVVIIFIIYGFSTEPAVAQLSPTMSYQSIRGIKPGSTNNLDTAFNQGNISGLYGLSIIQFTLPERIKTQDFTFANTDKFQYYLIKDPVLFDTTLNSYTWESLAAQEYETTVTFNSKWQRLTGKPLFDKMGVSYYPVKRIDKPTLSDNNLYRFAGNLFNMMMNYKYPYAKSHMQDPLDNSPR